MPMYSYGCQKCQHQFTKMLKIDDRQEPVLNPCPNCSESNGIELIIEAPSLLSPFRVDGLKKPPTQFKERMRQIKANMGRTKHTLKDHY